MYGFNFNNLNRQDLQDHLDFLHSRFPDDTIKISCSSCKSCQSKKP
jgi:hypothetical protein